MKVELPQPLLVTLRVIPVCETVSPIRCFSYVFKMAAALLKSKYGKKTGMPPSPSLPPDQSSQSQRCLGSPYWAWAGWAGKQIWMLLIQN